MSFLIYLHYQLSSIPLPQIKKYTCLNEVIYQIIKNKTLACLQQFYGKKWVGFWINTKALFIEEIAKNGPLKESNLFWKSVLFLYKDCCNSKGFLCSTSTVIIQKHSNLIGKLEEIFGNWVLNKDKITEHEIT